MSAADLSREIAERVREAVGARRPLALQGAGSKAFYGRPTRGEPLDLTGHAGIVSYQPTELVATVRCGTPLRELEEALAAHGQMLPFEPPRFGADTVGGCVATGLSGPGRPYRGSVRDAVLGARIVNGEGRIVRFGGEVMKNVAGYDLSRPMAGSLGTLGVILEVSLKVQPRPVAETALALECPPAETYRRTTRLLAEGAPLTGAAHDGRQLRLRLSGTTGAVAAARRHIGGEDDDAAFWQALRDHTHPLLGHSPLWRLSLPPDAPLPDDLPGERLIDWGGQQLWLRTPAQADAVFQAAAARGGHATRFHGGDDPHDAIFQPLPDALLDLHRRLKRALDPHGLFNPGRIHPEL